MGYRAEHAVIVGAFVDYFGDWAQRIGRDYSQPFDADIDEIFALRQALTRARFCGQFADYILQAQAARTSQEREQFVQQAQSLLSLAVDVSNGSRFTVCKVSPLCREDACLYVETFALNALATC